MTEHDAVTLTEDEREALLDWWDSESDGETAETMLANLDAAVERIIAARLAEHAAEHVHQIEALAAIVTDLDAELARVEALVDRWSGEWATPRWIDDLRAALDGGES